MAQHLTVRVPWHLQQWNGTVCTRASQNSFCLDLDQIRLHRDDEYEDEVAGRPFVELDMLPPCAFESGFFMSPRPVHLVRDHPYRQRRETPHAHLQPTTIRVPAFALLVRPFRWMLTDVADEIEAHLPRSLPPEEPAPFPTSWVYDPDRQVALLELFFEQIVGGESLVVVYTKSGHPLGDHINRLILGIGKVGSVGPLLSYDSTDPTRRYPLWERVVTHSIRADGTDGFLLPYHEYLTPTGDPDEDERRTALTAEIAVVPEAEHLAAVSYAGEHANPDVCLSILVRCLDAVRTVRRHGIAGGPWDAREDWLNAQISRVWEQRGAFPGLGSALEALGVRLGTALAHQLTTEGRLRPLEDPWPLMDAILTGREAAPEPHGADVAAVGGSYVGLSDERRELLRLLSRFALTPEQARRWWDAGERRRGTRVQLSDRDIIDNPYRIAEADLGGGDDVPVTIGVIDRGLLPDSRVAAACPVPPPTAVGSQNDPRRVRAALVTVLRAVAEEGDTLLAANEAVQRVQQLDLERHATVDRDWIEGNRSVLGGEIELLSLPLPNQPDGIADVLCLQLTEFMEREERLRSVLVKRAEKHLPSLGEPWPVILRRELGEPRDNRERAAFNEKVDALEAVTTRRLSVLVGRAGTGKTQVLGALARSPKLQQEGILFLAPTGKARVRITTATGAEALTVAQFLHRNQRYDGRRQRPRFEGPDQYRRERTVVIDESSMLTTDDLAAVLLALDLGHVQRVILVGDPNQLPPIGPGRPFADLVAHLDAAPATSPVSGALARLTVEMRSHGSGPSDMLRLASWYTTEQQPIDADRVLSDVTRGSRFADLEIRCWQTPDELHAQIDQILTDAIGLAGPDDVAGFNRSLGLTAEGWVPWEDHSGAERWQLLSPVRAHPHGVRDLNRWVQRRFRSAQLARGRKALGVSLGDEEIVWGDKVILTRNGERSGWRRGRITEYLANGELGLVALPNKNRQGRRPPLLNVCFTGRDGARFGFQPAEFPSAGDVPLELAYALTIHKAQGSDFGIVIVVLPRQSRLLSRELLYTALTRARERLILLVEGSDASFLYDFTRPERSETARRNTNLFAPGVRVHNDAIDVPYAEHLVHRTLRGELVRSKSELVIANYLHQNGLAYLYERELVGTVDPDHLRPDFSFVTDAGDVILWEHLGMLDRPDYRQAWEWKRSWYERNGFVVGQNLFTTEERNGLDMRSVEATAAAVQAALERA
jgi:hypothetical protein